MTSMIISHGLLTLSHLENMSPGPPPKLTVDETVRIMRDANRPFWSEKQFAERADVSKPTARKRLSDAISSGKIAETNANGGSVYYVPGKKMQRVGEDNNPIKTDLRGYWNDRFVGDPRNPTVVSTMMRTELTAGDQVKFLVMGRPGDWDYYETTTSDEPVGRIDPPGGEWYTAIITGELYAKPTVPIEHKEYHDDYDLELNIGGKYLDNGNLVAAGGSNHLIKPCDNALFLQDVTVEELNGPGPSMNDIETVYAPSQREKYTATQLRERGMSQNPAEEQE
jgi:hypothetical protein